MDLTALGRIGGIGGIAIGAVVLIIMKLIEKSGSAKPAQLALFQLTATGAFSIAGLGIIAWTAGGSSSPRVDVGPCAIGSDHDASGNSVSCATVPSASQIARLSSQSLGRL